MAKRGVLRVGQAYIVRTITYHYTGKLKQITDKWLVFSDAAWVADSGRWADALSKGTLNEVEPYCADLVINRDAVVDLTPWAHALPREQR
jgi:hypothetical protein